jgi:TolA-binding protein
LFGNVIGSIAYWPVQAVKAHYWLGVAYEQQGNKKEAVKEYKKFLKIWKDADFDSPEITDANRRVLKLSDKIK